MIFVKIQQSFLPERPVLGVPTYPQQQKYQLFREIWLCIIITFRGDITHIILGIPTPYAPGYTQQNLSKKGKSRKNALAAPKFSTLSTGFSTAHRFSRVTWRICILVYITALDLLRGFSHFFYMQHVDNRGPERGKNRT